ncbi:MAG: hypothetical protein AAF497_17805, partial [Planctomycetota bacterium]
GGVTFISTKHSAGQSYRVDAPTEGRSAVDLVRHFAQVPEIGRNLNQYFSYGSITNMESIVSASSAKQNENQIQAESVNLSLPEGSGLYVEFSGESVEVINLPPTGNKERSACVMIENGSATIVDTSGTERVVAKTVKPSDKLVVVVRLDNSEIAMSLSADRFPPGGDTSVAVQLTRSTTDFGEQGPPHGAISYAIHPEEVEKQKPFRFKMQWHYDLRQLAKETEKQSGLGLNELVGKAKPLPHNNEIVVKQLHWTDSSELPASIRQGCEERNRFGLIATVAGLSDMDEALKFVRNADLRVYLEPVKSKPGDDNTELEAKRLSVAFDGGCFWLYQDTMKIYVPFGPADRRDLSQDIAYRFVPRNSKPHYLWGMPKPLAIERKSE